MTQTEAIDRANFDVSVRPQDDFNSYCNGNWRKMNRRPRDLPLLMVFHQLDHKTRVTLRAIMESAMNDTTAAAGSNRAKAGAFWKSAMDEAAVEAAGLAPIQELLDSVDGLTSADALPALLAALHCAGVDVAFGAGPCNDFADSTRVLCWLVQGGLGLTDRDDYVETDARRQEMRREYAAHLARVFGLLGADAAAAAASAKRVLAFETDIARGHLTRTESRNLPKLYNPMSVDAMNAGDWPEADGTAAAAAGAAAAAAAAACGGGDGAPPAAPVMVETPYGAGELVELRADGSLVVRLGFGLAYMAAADVTRGTPVATPFGRGNLLRTRADGVRVVRLSFGVAYMGPEAELAPVKIATPYGEGEVAEERADGMSAVRLSFGTLFAREAELRAAAAAAACVATPYGDGEVVEKRCDGSAVVRLSFGTLFTHERHPSAAASAATGAAPAAAAAAAAEAPRSAPGAKARGAFDWHAYFDGIGLRGPRSSVVVQVPALFKFLTDAANGGTDLQTWRDYLKWHVVRAYSGFLPARVVKASHDFYGKVVSGTRTLEPRWKRMLKAANAAMAELIGEVYCAEKFPESSKAQVVLMVNRLKDALRARINSVDWMGPETKARALEKLAAFRVKIGFPDKWTDYGALEIAPGAPLAQHMLAANRFEFAREVARMNAPVDRDLWEMSPQTINAYYHPLNNEIVFPAAFLQFPFFDPKNDAAVNFGAAGAVIGHEMTHGYDDQGGMFDADGNMRNWWTDADKSEFQKRCGVIVDQYGDYKVHGKPVNGAMTLGENIADIGGVKLAYTALQAELAETGARDVVDGFTPEQRFFLSYAQVWRCLATKQAALTRLTCDVHSPGDARVLGPLSNLPEFYEAFGVKEGDRMFRPEEKRADIW